MVRWTCLRGSALLWRRPQPNRRSRYNPVQPRFPQSAVAFFGWLCYTDPRKIFRFKRSNSHANRLCVKGNILYTPVCGELARHPGAYLVCENGTVAGIFATLPDRYQGIPVEDYGDKLILPGLVDLHVHGGQYAYRGLGMDMELLDWLEKNAFRRRAALPKPPTPRRPTAFLWTHCCTVPPPGPAFLPRCTARPRCGSWRC